MTDDFSRSPGTAAPKTGDNRQGVSLIVLDASYTLEMIEQRGLHNPVLCRDLDGFFRHVWSVHPFASLLTSPGWASRFGTADWHELSARHTFIEGKIGRFRWLCGIFPVNFAIGQLGLLLRLAWLARREGVKVIRAGDPLYLGLFGWLLARLSGAAFTIRVNGNNDAVRQVTGQAIFPRLFKTAATERRIEHFVFPRADLVFAPNADNAAFARANGAPEAAVEVVNLGSLLGDDHFVDPRNRPTADDDLRELDLQAGQYLLCIGRLEMPKFPDHVIETLAALRPLHPQLKALFVGDGSMRGELAALARKLGVDDAVVFAGNRDQQFLSRIIPHAAVVLSPSTGRALSEAALGAVPIVAYDTDWQRDMIETEVTGVLVPYRDRAAMTAAAARFLAEPAFARAMGDAVRHRAMTMLDPAAGLALEREHYHRMLTARGYAS